MKETLRNLVAYVKSICSWYFHSNIQYVMLSTLCWALEIQMQTAQAERLLSASGFQTYLNY